MTKPLTDDFMTAQLRAAGLTIARAVRHADLEVWRLHMCDEASTEIDVPFSITEHNLSPAIAAWVTGCCTPQR